MRSWDYSSAYGSDCPIHPVYSAQSRAYFSQRVQLSVIKCTVTVAERFKVDNQQELLRPCRRCTQTSDLNRRSLSSIPKARSRIPLDLQGNILALGNTLLNMTFRQHVRNVFAGAPNVGSNVDVVFDAPNDNRRGHDQRPR